MSKAVTRAAWVVIALAFVASAVNALTPNSQTSDLLYLSAAIGFVVALIFGVVAKNLKRLTLPILIVGSLTASHHITRLATQTTNVKILVECLYLLIHLVLAIWLVFLVQRRIGGDALNVAADSAIMGLGAWFLIWFSFLNSARDNIDQVFTVVAIRGATLSISVVVLFMVVTMLLGDAKRTFAIWVSSIAILLFIVGYLGHAIKWPFEPTIQIANSPFIASLFFCSAAVLHPSLKNIAAHTSTVQRQPLLSRLVLMTSALVIPVLIASISQPTNSVDKWVRASSILVLTIAVTARVLFSIRANILLQARLIESAQTDALTKLPNRALMLEHVSVAIANAKNLGLAPTALFIDVDRFKNINDSLGHSAGDDVLIAVAQRLRIALPDRCIVGRISGDEFVVLDEKTKTQADAVLLADLVLESFHEPLALRQGDVFVSASIGVAIHDYTTTNTADELLRNADTAMYRAKAAGRNCVALFDQSMLDNVNQRLAIETALYRALERHELTLVHQPIIDINLGDVIGFEALMRWDRLDGSAVSPAEFIPIAEETGIIVPIGSWALLEALTHLRNWISQGICRRDATMSVNVSPRQLHDPNFVAIINEALMRSNVPAEQLWLEVTEGVMITQPEQALDTLRELSIKGVRIAIDDFGTGYSSLSFLQRFPIHRLKIDRSFISELGEDSNSRSLVKTIIAMADSLGIDVVAEGVETVQQLHALSDLHCAKAQGFLISHPVPPQAMAITVTGLDKIGKWPRLRPLN